jgi:hypothetical protein
MQVPLPNVSSSVLVKVLQYCEHHKNDPLPAPDANDQDDARRKTAEIGEWDAKFIVRVDPPLFRSTSLYSPSPVTSDLPHDTIVLTLKSPLENSNRPLPMSTCLCLCSALHASTLLLETHLPARFRC